VIDVAVFQGWADSVRVLALAPVPPAAALSKGVALLRLFVRSAFRGAPGTREAALIAAELEAFAKALYRQLSIHSVDWNDPDWTDPRVRTIVTLFPLLSDAALMEMIPVMFSREAPSEIGRSVLKKLTRMHARGDGEFEDFVFRSDLMSHILRVAGDIAPQVRWSVDAGWAAGSHAKGENPAVLAIWRLLATGAAKTKPGAPVAFPGAPQLPPGIMNRLHPPKANADGEKPPEDRPRLPPPQGLCEGPPTSAREGWASDGGAAKADTFRGVFWPVFLVRRASEDVRDLCLRARADLSPK
jgi:hypothetical protein